MFDFRQIEKFFSKADLSHVFQIISDRTVNDLDLEDVFRFIDRTRSRPGQQYLYYLMRCIPATSDRVASMERTIEIFENCPSLRTTISEELSKLNEHNAYYICSLFQGEQIKKPKSLWVIQLLSILAVASVILSLWIPKIAIFLIALFPVNMGIHYWNKSNIYQYIISIPQLVVMHRVASKVIDNEGIQSGYDLIDSVESLAKMTPAMSMFKIEAKLQSEIGQLIDYLLELVKALFLLEPVILFSTLQKLETKGSQIQRVFKFVSEMDVALSIMSLRESVPHFCKITHESVKTIRARNLYHPLIFNGVANDISLKGKSVILTGSNMSGKTTFVRTVGISAILGQTLNTCFATEFTMPLMRVQTSIRISDDLLDNKSYYMEEVLALKQLVEGDMDGKGTLILLDELLKGTNSIERIAISAAVLGYLERKGNLVFVSTHDRELAEFLSESYDLYHFTEVIKDDQIVFDYKLKPGMLKTTNAIRFLALNKFPTEITDQANRLLQKLAGLPVR